VREPKVELLTNGLSLRWLLFEPPLPETVRPPLGRPALSVRRVLVVRQVPRRLGQAKIIDVRDHQTVRQLRHVAATRRASSFVSRFISPAFQVFLEIDVGRRVIVGV